MIDRLKVIEALKPSSTNSPFYLLFAGVIFSFGSLLFRLTSIYAEDTTFAGPWRFMLYRFLGMFIYALAWQFVAGISGPKELTCANWPWVSRRRVASSAIGGGMMAICNIAFIIALSRIDVATVLLLQALSPFSAAGLGWLFLKERTDLKTGVTMVCAVVGVGIMGSGWQSTDPIGLGAALFIAVGLGFYTVLLRGKGEAAPVARVQLLLNSCIGMMIVTPVIIATAPNGAAALIVPPLDMLYAMTGAHTHTHINTHTHTLTYTHLHSHSHSHAAGLVSLGIGLTFYNIAGAHVPAARTSLLMMSEVSSPYHLSSTHAHDTEHHPFICNTHWQNFAV
jgi:drug/metabolite transporter (DMT)-like permease